jgi:hypothetical protein
MGILALLIAGLKGNNIPKNTNIACCSLDQQPVKANVF